MSGNKKSKLKHLLNAGKIGNERQDIFQLRGVRPFLSDKFDITKHKNYKLLEDFDKKNVFDIEDYIKRKGKVKLNRNTVISRL